MRNLSRLSFFILCFQKVIIMFRSLAVVGASGAVGKLICKLLEERSFPVTQVKFLGSSRSAGTTIRFRDQEHVIELLRPEAFDDVDLCIASTPDDVAQQFIPQARARGVLVIDESGAWRMDPQVPLVVPEVNAAAALKHQGLIASPNCSTTQMVVALKPLHDAARVRRVVVSTYQATSGAGVAGSWELEANTRATLSQESFRQETFAHPIAFNLIPQIGSAKYEGYTSEEMKMIWETQKIFEDPSMTVCPTCVRVPVANCHSEMICVETERRLTVSEARELFAQAPGIRVVDDLEQQQYPMPLACDGRDEVFVGRIRADLSHPHGLVFWCVSDNLRKGAATNAVQIAELLMQQADHSQANAEVTGGGR